MLFRSLGEAMADTDRLLTNAAERLARSVGIGQALSPEKQG